MTKGRRLDPAITEQMLDRLLADHNPVRLKLALDVLNGHAAEMNLADQVILAAGILASALVGISPPARPFYISAAIQQVKNVLAEADKAGQGAT
jgi:hypothetical protein